jgi:hypothetical protein
MQSIASTVRRSRPWQAPRGWSRSAQTEVAAQVVFRPARIPRQPAVVAGPANVLEAGMSVEREQSRATRSLRVGARTAMPPSGDWAVGGLVRRARRRDDHEAMRLLCGQPGPVGGRA